MNQSKATSKRKIEQVIESSLKDPVTHKKIKLLQKELSKHIYVNPVLYKALLNLNIAKTKEELGRRTKYSVYTKPTNSTIFPTYCFYTDKQHAEAIKTLINQKSQRIFENFPLHYKKGILSIIGYRIDLGVDSEKDILCKSLFRNKYKLSYDELEELFPDEKYTNKKHYDYLRAKVLSLNEFVCKNAEIPKFVELKNGSVSIDPIYLPAK